MMGHKVDIRMKFKQICNEVLEFFLRNEATELVFA